MPQAVSAEEAEPQEGGSDRGNSVSGTAARMEGHERPTAN